MQSPTPDRWSRARRRRRRWWKRAPAPATSSTGECRCCHWPVSGSLFDRTLLGALYQQHHEELFRYAARFTGDADQAEDIVQEAFLRLSERPPAQAEAIRAWLFRAATTIAIDAYRT